MKQRSTPFSLLLFLIVWWPLWPDSALRADDGSKEEASLTGSFTLGWRSVDTSGREEKYRQHINQEDGASLFGLNLEYLPRTGRVDEVRLNITDLGSSPYQNIDFLVRKYGSYKFKMGRRESTYFYDDLILPVELGSPALANAGDLHHFDYRRVRDFASLEFRLNPRAKLDVGFDRYSKQGERTTTLDISRDEFEFDQRLDQQQDEFRVGFQYAWDKATIAVTETYQEFDNAWALFLPGQSLGENRDDQAILDFYFLDQPTDLSTQQHHVSLNLRPTTKVMLKISGSLFNFDLESAPSETSKGISFTGAPFTTDVSGAVKVERDMQLFDVDFSYLLNSRVALVAGLRQQTLDQDGDARYQTETLSRWEIDTTTLEGGVEFMVVKDMTVGLGVRQETREVDSGRGATGVLDLQRQETDHTGYYLNAAWTPKPMLRVNAEFEDSSYDDPFTLASPTGRQRLRLQARLKGSSGVFGSATYLSNTFENSNSLWDSDTSSVSLRGGYRGNGISVSLGYGLVDVERRIDQLVTTAPGFGGGQQFLFPIFFKSDSEFIDCNVRWQANEGLALGADLRLYENGGDFDRRQDDYRLYADIDLAKGYLVHLGYRIVNYEEPLLGFNDYDADIAEFGVGYRFN